MRLFLVFALAGMLVACAMEFKTPITGQYGGVPAAGQATVTTERGTFWVAVAGGARCEGSYDPFDVNPTISTAVFCTDGRMGQALITRQMSGLGGAAIVSLNDGKIGQFVFGDLTFEQAYGNGAQAKVKPTR